MTDSECRYKENCDGAEGERCSEGDHIYCLEFNRRKRRDDDQSRQKCVVQRDHGQSLYTPRNLGISKDLPVRLNVGPQGRLIL